MLYKEVTREDMVDMLSGRHGRFTTISANALFNRLYELSEETGNDIEVDIEELNESWTEFLTPWFVRAFLPEYNRQLPEELQIEGHKSYENSGEMMKHIAEVINEIQKAGKIERYAVEIAKLLEKSTTVLRANNDIWLVESF